MAIKEGFSETRPSTSHGKLKKSNEVTSFEAILIRNTFSNVFVGIMFMCNIIDFRDEAID